jgi:hypothetical protein
MHGYISVRSNASDLMYPENGDQIGIPASRLAANFELQCKVLKAFFNRAHAMKVIDVGSR